MARQTPAKMIALLKAPEGVASDWEFSLWNDGSDVYSVRVEKPSRREKEASKGTGLRQMTLDEALDSIKR